MYKDCKSRVRLLIITTLLFCCCGSPAAEEIIEREQFTYHLDNPAYAELIDSVLNQTSVRLKKLLGAELSYKAHIYVVEDLDKFNKLTRGVLPDWGAAVAFPQRQLMAIKSPDAFNINRSLEELLAHEYSHLILADLAGFHDVPRWFNEGLAMYISMEWSWSDNLTLSRAAVFGQLLTLKEIENVNRFGEGKAHVAYSQSYLAVKYFFDEYGNGQAAVFIDSIAEGTSIDQALLGSIGSTYKEFNDEFKKSLTKRYNVVSLFMDTMFFWIGLSAIVLVATYLRYKKRRKYYKKWEEDEKYHSTDFDYGDPDNPEVPDDDEPWRS